MAVSHLGRDARTGEGGMTTVTALSNALTERGLTILDVIEGGGRSGSEPSITLRCPVETAASLDRDLWALLHGGRLHYRWWFGGAFNAAGALIFTLAVPALDPAGQPFKALWRRTIGRQRLVDDLDVLCRFLPLPGAAPEPERPVRYREDWRTAPVEGRIRPLVDVLNATGRITTHASCEGHWGGTGPYVAFTCGLETAAVLDAGLRACRRDGRLRHSWHLGAGFDPAGTLIFALRLAAWKRHTVSRAVVDQDLHALASMAKALFPDTVHAAPLRDGEVRP